MLRILSIVLEMFPALLPTQRILATQPKQLWITMKSRIRARSPTFQLTTTVS
ncbi:unnamed protein product [Strongylus vulgaris]|uniref:Uncharacterized protein n=1 Tax=Strongylus vulgaris TaxID=40348 RepID=A0A3P7JH19_STRVU|nr:unnamed protein product [Strongylus vulgaris]